MITRGTTTAAVLLVSLSALAACGSSGGDAASSPGSTAAGATPPSVQIRPVLTERLAKGEDCSAVAPTSPPVSKPLTAACSFDKSVRYGLGPAVITQKDVTAISTAKVDAGTDANGDHGDPVVVTLALDPKGTLAFAALTKLASKQEPPRSDIAILVGGVVVTAPQVASGPITSGQFEIHFPTESDASAFVKAWPAAQVRDALPEPTASVG